MNVIHTGLIKHLVTEYEVHIISNLIGPKEIAEINQYFGIEIYKTDIKIPVENILVKVLRLLEKLLFLHFFKIETQIIKVKQKGIWYHLSTGILIQLIKILGLSTISLKFLRKQIISISGAEPLLDPLADYNFCGVISSSPMDVRENTIVNFMKKAGIPSLAMIISWDNLTSKGIINADHDYVLVWNEFMADEYNRFYSMFGVSNLHLYPTGIPRFDIYFNQLTDENTALFRKKYKLSDADKTILFATSAITHFPNQTDIVRHLLEYTSGKQNVKIIVRCHASDNFELYRQFINEPNLRIWHVNNTRNASSQSSLMPDLNILQGLHEMLEYCSVCINIASTIRLEAAVCNKPGISIAYDGELQLPFHRSVRRFYAYSHQIPLNKTKVDKTVFNKNELFGSLDEILYNSQDVQVTYKSRIDKFVYQSGPFAVDATMKYVRQWLS